jgi:hypothetical protein
MKPTMLRAIALILIIISGLQLLTACTGAKSPTDPLTFQRASGKVQFVEFYSNI